MGFLRFFDETVDFFISDIRKQTGKGFIETFTDKGNYGEFLSYKYLINTPGKRDYVHNCYVPTANGYTEIDFILLHETGIYVVESKNYSGWIFGDEKSKNWTQVLAGGKTKVRFYNPIRQNAGHINALKSFLQEYPDLRYYSLIVFSERCELKKVSCQMPDTYVVKRNDLKAVFKRQIKERDKFPEKTLAEIGSLLKPFCRLPEEDKTAHIERVKALQGGKPVVLLEPIDLTANIEVDLTDNDEPVMIDESTAAEIAAFEAEAADEAETEDFGDEDVDDVTLPQTGENQNLIMSDESPNLAIEAMPLQCPRCQRALVERNGKNGHFLGCTGFPRCRYTKSL